LAPPLATSAKIPGSRRPRSITRIYKSTENPSSGWGDSREARIKIDKVQDVGYRVFLLDLALELWIKRFAAKAKINGG